MLGYQVRNGVALPLVTVSEVRRRATFEVVEGRNRRKTTREMVKLAVIAFALTIGLLFEGAAGFRWDTILAALLGLLSAWGISVLNNWRSNKSELTRLRLVEQGQKSVSDEKRAELDLKERERIDQKVDSFIELIRESHAQQSQNMQAIVNSQQAIINNHQAIIENQKEAMKLKDIELERRDVKISDLQKELLKLSMAES